MKRIYQLNKEDLYWKLKAGLKSKILKQCEAVLDDPDASYRDKGIAVKNIIACNGQNIQLCPDVQHDAVLNIKIVEEGSD